MAAELFELLRFDYKNSNGKSVQLYQTRFPGNYQLVISTRGKQIYVLTSNVLTHIVTLKHAAVQSCFVTKEQKVHILTSSGQIFAVTLSDPASDVSDVDLNQDPKVIEIPEKHSVAEFSNALAFLPFGKKIFVLCEAFGAFYLEVISDCSGIEQSKEKQRDSQYLDALQIHHNNRTMNPATIQTRLYILVPFSCKDYNSNDSSMDVLRVCDQLYNCLFGQHLNLTNSAILLIVQSGGMIHWLPLRGSPSESDVLDGSSAGLVNGTNVFCDLEQDVVGVFSCTINASKSTNRGKSLPPQSVLLLIGRKGLVMIINRELRDGNLMPGFQRCLVPGPVVCCDVSAAVLFYSTGSDLLHVDLHEVLADSKGCGMVQHLKTKSFNICNIVALSICMRETAKSGETDLFVVTSRGCVSRLSLDLSNCCSRDLQDPSQALSSLLIGIRQLSDKYRTLDNNSQMLDVALNQLSLAGLVLSQGKHFIQGQNERAQSCQRSTAQSNVVFSALHCVTNIQISHSKLHITVVFQNCSSFVFRKCWIFQVTVSKEAAETGMPLPCVSSSCCIDGLSTGESASVMVELPCNFTSPFLISPSLILNLQALLPSSASLTPLVMPLPSELFDELRLLRPLTHCRALTMGAMHYDLSRTLQTIADQHSYKSAPQKDRLSTSEVQDCRFDICIPDQITQEIVLIRPSMKADKGDDCEMVLWYLLSSNSFCKDLSYENMTLRAVSTCGHLVTINVHLSGPANSGVSVVSLQSSHTGLLAQLHLDITSRLKTLSCVRRTAPSYNTKYRNVLLKEVEDLLLEFHDRSGSTASTLSKVSSLYRSVRSMRL